MTAGTAVCATTPDPLLAHIWRDVLATAGIPSEIYGEHLSTVYPRMAHLATISLIVRAEDLERAREALAEAEHRASEAGLPGGRRSADGGCGASAAATSTPRRAPGILTLRRTTAPANRTSR